MSSQTAVRTALKFTADLLAVGLSFGLGTVLAGWRPGGSFTFDKFLPMLGGMIIVRAASFVVFGVPRQKWSFITLRDLERLSQAVTFSSLLFYASYFATTKELFSLRLGAVDTLVLIFLLSLFRFIVSVGNRRSAARGATHTLIVGAGEAGEMVCDEIFRHPELGLKLVGFIDDDKRKIGTSVRGVRVLCDRHSMPEIIEREAIGHIIIAIPSTSGDRIRGIVDQCRGFDVEVQIVPALKEIIDGTVRLEQIRPIRVEDLLHRAPVEIDLSRVKKSFYCKCVLITGAGGSIGSELARQIGSYSPEKLILLDIDETAIFNLHRELSGKHLSCAICPIVEDICDESAIKALFARHSPDIVFHAAAHKHAPLMDLNFRRVIRNNVFGTLNLLREAKNSGVASFVLISSDKAVEPLNFMGASKKLCEILTRRYGEGEKGRFAAVRFGNVLGSQGSVVPIFEEQIRNGGPVTVTHPEATRYFMTIYEAVQLITQATVLARNGEVQVLDMGKPIRIKDLAEDLISLCSTPRQRRVQIRYVGLRQGEKLSEALCSEDEEVRRTVHPKINVAVSRKPLDVDLDSAMDSLFRAVHWGSKEEIIETIREVIPDFSPQASLDTSLGELAFPLSYDMQHPPEAQPVAKMGYVEPY
ncbi:MAG: polysaccharide biosynthesis protein [Candidatus Coatesbacteria bacterium]|nr:polysaccharide biosynthesis protein [Candidatus Coatesbacteria bacterium]